MDSLLQLETSGDFCSVAISQHNTVLAERISKAKLSHAAEITLLIQSTLEDAGLDLKDISAVALSAGPGSYTGLRVGAATAKGICYAMNIPLVAINTLELMAAGLMSVYKQKADFFCPAIDARRNLVYTALFTAEFIPVLNPQPMEVDGKLAEMLRQKVPIAIGGSGAAKIIDANPTGNFLLIDDFYPLASQMIQLAWKKFTDRKFSDVAYFEPQYLKAVHVTQPKNPLKR